MRSRRTAIAAILIAAFSSTLPAVAEGDCPEPADPKTCAEWTILEGAHRWRLTPAGLAEISYYVNPRQPWMPEAEVVAAVRTAFQTWEDWNPSLRFTFLGTTLTGPVPQDGMNVVGFLPFYAKAAATPQPEEGMTDTRGNRSGYMSEADIILDISAQWQWDRCEQEDGSCFDRVTREPITKLTQSDVQAIVTHEVGHLLGLDHVDGVGLSVVTMAGKAAGGDRHLSTLALGDVLGAKFLYPWSCPPTGQPTPPRYQRVCPMIQIFSP